MIDNIKNYDCSRDGKKYNILDKPVINLYIQTTSKCNASCNFCDTRCTHNDFNLEKLQQALELLEKDVYLGKVAITGGEPLLFTDRIKQIVEICNGKYLALNTNAYDLDRLEEIYPLVNEIHVSKHHYDNNINDRIMKLKTPSFQEISYKGLQEKIKINCVYQKGGMQTKEDLIFMMEEMAKYGFKEIRNISMLPLTQAGISEYVDLIPLMRDCECFTNDGYLFDKGMCQCFEFVYVASNGKIVKSLIRQTFNDDYPCIKQFVFDGKNLYDGFKKKNIIL